MRLAEKLTAQTFIKGFRTLRDEGVEAFARKLKARLRPAIDYEEWRRENSPSEDELKRQRNATWETMPLFSVVVPLYRTPERYLREMIESVTSQTYVNWELCLSDGSGDVGEGTADGNDAGPGATEQGTSGSVEAGQGTVCETQVEKIIKEYQKKYENIRYIRSDKPLQIAENTNLALTLVSGDYIAFMDHDDTLTPDALYEAAKVIVGRTGNGRDADKAESKTPDLIYSDEDKLDMKTGKYFMPHFKPDFNIDLLRSVNYICHLCIIKKEFADRLGGLLPEMNGAQDYDYILRAVEQTENIVHIPKVLYHWRSHENSTAENPESKRYAFEAGKLAITRHYERLGIPASVEDGISAGIYKTTYHWQEKPLISVLIPNKDHTEDLEKCLQSLFRSSYHNYEVIVIENNSEKPETFAYYERVQTEHVNVTVVTYKAEGGFNYSKINNFGAQYANGEYLLLLNNDIEFIGTNCLEELLGYAMREDVGAVGARLYFEDDTIQHAGVVIGFGGIAGHTFVNQRREELGYFARAMCQQNYSAVTAACMLTRTEDFRSVGGLTEELSVAFNDIDYCMKLREKGKLIVYNPYAEGYHYESKSRGAEDTPEKKLRFHREILWFGERWQKILDEGDPYYNPNLTLERADFALKLSEERNRPKGYYMDLVGREVEKETNG